MNCVYCSTLLPERAFYCLSCSKQIKCKNCDELLEPNAQACIMCGSKVGSGEINTNEKVVSMETMNTFEFSETPEERKAKAILTDESVKSLSETLTGVVTAKSLLNYAKANEKLQLSENINTTGLETETDLATDGKIIEVKAKVVSVNESEIVEKLKSTFYLDENKFILEVQDLKSSKQLDYGKRIVYLQLLYSKEVLGEDFVSREVINETLLEVMKVRDSNLITWLTNATDLFRKTEDGKEYLRLKTGKDGGQETALQILAEVFDDNKKGTFFPEKKSKTTAKNNKSSSKKTNSKTKINSKTKEIEDWMKSWKELKLNIDLHNIAKKISTLDKIVLGLWVVYKSTSGKVDTLTTFKLANLITEQFVIKVTRQSFDQTLTKDVKNYVMKNPNGWKITPTGITYAESLTKSSNSTANSKAKK